jgi:subtilisin family serine protease
MSNTIPSSHNTATNRYIVSLRGKATTEESLDFLKEDGFRHMETFDFPQNDHGDLILVEARDGKTSLRDLASDPRVEFVEADEEVTLVRTEEQKKPNDLSSSLWGLHNSRGNVDIDAPEAWTKNTGRREGGPIIAVLDTGLDLQHTDLKDNLWVNAGEIPGNGKDDDGNGVVDDVHGFDAYNQTGAVTDHNGHGTHCAGTIGAVGDNDKGIVGVNWQTQIMPIKIFDDKKEKPRAPRSAILRGLSYAAKNGARVTSNSWGGGGRSRSVERAFQNFDAFHVMAAGNDTENNDEKSYYPSNYDVDHSLAVASIDRYGNLSDFSNYGETNVDLAAPGTFIYSTLPDDKYGYLSGTSMATPHVTGVVGLLLSERPELTNRQLKYAVLQSVDKRESLKGKVASGGSLNANKALELLS